MSNFIARAKVILEAAVTYLALIGAVVAIIVSELANYADNPTVEWVLRILGVVATVVAVATSIIRRVTPVLPSERGVLPRP